MNKTWKLNMILLDHNGDRVANRQVSVGANKQLVGYIDSAAFFRDYFTSNRGDFTGTLNIQVIDGRAANFIGFLQRKSDGQSVISPEGKNAYTP